MSNGHYPLHREGSVEASPNFPELERRVLAFWEEDGTFQASVDKRPAGPEGSNEFVFYDGPPFANGLPHYGHLLTGYVKDVVGRYQTMRGRRVERRFGWDTHGLPAELEAERILGVTDKSQIEGEGGIGIQAFNDAARAGVLTYTEEWRDYVTRQARWVDFDHDYKTLDTTFMESVIWAFKTMYDKGYIYEGFRVLPYCWNDETPLTNHELKMDDEIYQDRTDQTVTVGLRLEEPVRDGATTPELILIWTTTPWTLPSNSAVAVGPDVDYAVVRVPGEAGSPVAGQDVIVAEALLASYAKELGEAPEILARLKGEDLVGRRYHPIFDYFDTPEARAEGGTPGPRAWTILAADFVTTDDGTGLVHMAPAFGEDDMNACLEAGIGAVVPVDDAGRFTPAVPDYAGMQVFESNRRIIADLRDGTGPIARREPNRRAVLVRQASYRHSYPHCWRCRQPLIYKAVSSWFVKVTAFRDRMVELNQRITWVPEHVKDGIFGNWLAGARDWSISRSRFWGSPIPVWKSDDPAHPRIDVYGSLAEIERDFGRLPVGADGEVDLHRPAIDGLVRPNPDDPTGRSTMRRVPDVLDTWFDSGAMPFAQVHYPFENREWFDEHYPGDFIVEYIGQTRGWFYTLHVMATALFDKPSFTNCVSHGIVLGDDGRKMSKSLRNYPDVAKVFEEYGSDAMRWFLMSSPVVRGGNLIVTEDGIRDAVRHVLLPLWNTYYFFTLYADAADKGAGYLAAPVDVADPDAVAALDVQDRYLLANTKDLVDALRAQLDAYGHPDAARLPRHADQLVRAHLARPLLERGPRRLRHPLHGAGRRLPGRRPALAAPGRGDVARTDRGALRPPGRLARTARGRGGSRPRRPDGRSARHRLGRPFAAQGEQAPGASAPAQPRRRHRPGPRGVPGAHRRRGQRQGRATGERGVLGDDGHTRVDRSAARTRAGAAQIDVQALRGRPRGRMGGDAGRRPAPPRSAGAPARRTVHPDDPRAGRRGLRCERPALGGLHRPRHDPRRRTRSRRVRPRRHPGRSGRAQGRGPARGRPDLADASGARRARRGGPCAHRPHRRRDARP